MASKNRAVVWIGGAAGEGTPEEAGAVCDTVSGGVGGAPWAVSVVEAIPATGAVLVPGVLGDVSIVDPEADAGLLASDGAVLRGLVYAGAPWAGAA